LEKKGAVSHSVSRPRLSRFVEKPSYGLRKVYQGYPVPAASSPIFHHPSIGRDPPLRDMRRMRKEPSFNASTSSIIIGFCHFYSHGYSLIQFFSQLKRGFSPTLFSYWGHCVIASLCQEKTFIAFFAFIGFVGFIACRVCRPL
jgi:hypothetical protein